MKKNVLGFLVPGLFGATVLALSLSAAAQTPPAATPAPAAKSPEAAPMTGPHKGSHAGAKHHADMKAECQGMAAKRQEMQDKLKTMDATLDKLVAEMNAARASKAVDALEKPMLAVINELVVQRKASVAMMVEMHHAMMKHMAQHMSMGGGKGAMDCPMMKMGGAPDGKVEDKKPMM
jgi:hypothetical protein